jgi:hypothetical protein
MGNGYRAVDGRSLGDLNKANDEFWARGGRGVTTPARDVKKELHEVVVGNIGTIHSGYHQPTAEQHYNNYVAQSKSGSGRAGGESVTHLKNGNVHREHIGSNERTEDADLDIHVDPSPHKYPKTLTLAQRSEAAKNIKAALRGKTGQARAEARAEQMDPGPSDDAEYTTTRGGISEKAGTFTTSRGEVSNPSTKKSKTGVTLYKHEPKSGPHAGKTLYVSVPEDDESYESKERAAIQGESRSKGSTSFNFGANKAKVLAVDPVKRKTPKNYEKRERAAIRGEARSKGSTAFKFGANRDEGGAGEVKVERKIPYQGVGQYGITGSSEITPSRATAAKWAAQENAARKSKPKDDADASPKKDEPVKSSTKTRVTEHYGQHPPGRCETCEGLRVYGGATGKKPAGQNKEADAATPRKVGNPAAPQPTAANLAKVRGKPDWPAKTPKNYEAQERAAIRGEGKAKGSVAFP